MHRISKRYFIMLNLQHSFECILHYYCGMNGNVGSPNHEYGIEEAIFRFRFKKLFRMNKKLLCICIANGSVCL